MTETTSSNSPRGKRPEVPREDLRYDIPCLVCGSNDRSVKIDDPPFQVVQCLACEFVYTIPRLPPAKIEEMYQVDYWNSDEAKSFGYTDYLKDRELYLRTYRMRSKFIDKFKSTPGRLLDVGCAAGFFLKVMEDKGWKTTGVELSQYVSDYARNELGLQDVRTGSITDHDFGNERFDVISMWDVIEHLEDPRPILQRVVDLLKDDGILILETQNVDSFFAKIMGKKWTHYKHEEHLYHFSEKTLTRFLKDFGLEAQFVTPRRGGKFVSLNFIVERLGKINPFLSALASPLRLLGNRALYVNPYDEMIGVFTKQTIA